VTGKRGWGVHSDLSGRCWIPPEVLRRAEGYYEDVPRRLYLHTPWGSLVVGSRSQAWLPVLGFLPYRPRWAWLCWWWVVWSPRTRKRGLLVRWKPGWYS
jgi:hypothetical protein